MILIRVKLILLTRSFRTLVKRFKCVDYHLDSKLGPVYSVLGQTSVAHRWTERSVTTGDVVFYSFWVRNKDPLNGRPFS